MDGWFSFVLGVFIGAVETQMPKKKTLIGQLQLIQNFLASSLTRTWRTQHIIPRASGRPVCKD